MHGAHGGVDLVHAGHHDHSGSRLERQDLLHEREAIQSGHSLVGDNDIRGSFAEDAKCLERIDRGDHFEPGIAQLACNGDEIVTIVIDDQKAPFHDPEEWTQTSPLPREVGVHANDLGAQPQRRTLE